jgi:hypothetical protein
VYTEALFCDCIEDTVCASEIIGRMTIVFGNEVAIESPATSDPMITPIPKIMAPINMRWSLRIFFFCDIKKRRKSEVFFIL